MKQIKILSDTRTVDMADEWFDIADTNHFWMQWRFKALMKNSNSSINDPILEIGCGNGIAMRQFEMQGFRIDGCDLNLHALKKIENVQGEVMLYDIYDLKPDLIEKYSSIVLCDIIEHISDDKDFILTALKHLKKNGVIIINVPALNFLFSNYDVIAGHKRRYTKKMLKKIFEEANIELIAINYWGFLLLPIAIIRKIMLAFVRKEKIIEKGFHPPNKLVHLFLRLLMAIELRLFSKPFVGTSVIAIGRKK